MKATVLADNIGEGPLAGEWGLSIYIEYENKKILLDTGASALLRKRKSHGYPAGRYRLWHSLPCAL